MASAVAENGPSTDSADRLRSALPVFCSHTVSVADVPISVEGKESVVALKVSTGTGGGAVAAPVPTRSSAIVGRVGSLVESVRVPVDPPSVLGVNTMVIELLLPAATVTADVGVLKALPDTDAATVRVWLPTFWMVRLC